MTDTPNLKDDELRNLMIKYVDVDHSVSMFLQHLDSYVHQQQQKAVREALDRIWRKSNGYSLDPQYSSELFFVVDQDDFVKEYERLDNGAA